MVSENEMDHDDQDDCEYIEDCESDSDLELEEICPLRDDSKVIFQGHSSGILCVELDEKNNTAFTGALDDKVMIWELSSGRLIEVLGEHTDSVTHICVNKSGQMLASGDMSGAVIIWQRSGHEKRWSKLHNIEAATIVSLTWSSQNSELLFICDVVGTVQSWSLSSLEQGPASYKYGQGCSCNKSCLVLNDAWSAVLYGETCGEHEDCGNTSSLHMCHNGSERSVKVDLRGVAACKNEDDLADEGLGCAWANKAIGQAHIIVIGDWDQFIVASITAQGYTAQCKLTKVAIRDGGLVDNISFAAQFPFVAFSTKLGSMGVYDLQKQTIRCVWNYANTMPAELRQQNGEDESGISQLCWSPTKAVFYTSGLDGRLCEWDGRAAPATEVPTMWGYSGIVWDMKITSDGSALVIVSEDKVGRVFAI